MTNSDTTIQKRQAKSKKVATSDPSILHDTTRSRITLVPFYVPHKNGPDELCVKIIRSKKQAAGVFPQIVDDQAISLQGPATLALLKALQLNTEVSTQDDGSYLLIKVQDGSADIGAHDPAAIANALTKLLSREDIVNHLDGLDLSDELISSLDSAIRIREMRSAVEDLRAKLQSGEARESKYQEWCQAHTWAFGSSYLVGDDLRNISISDNLDMLLPTVIGGYRDLVELKRPDMPVLFYDKSHKNYYWSADVTKAIGQSHRYLDVLHEAAASGLLDRPEIVAYHPRATIVIGRSSTWQLEQYKALHGLNRRLSSISVMTYDQLLSQGERLVDIVSNPKQEEEKIANTSDFDDEIPW